MKKLPVLIILISLFSCFDSSGGVTLTAITQPGKTAVSLQWNMVNYPGSTAYTLFKSADGSLGNYGCEPRFKELYFCYDFSVPR